MVVVSPVECRIGGAGRELRWDGGVRGEVVDVVGLRSTAEADRWPRAHPLDRPRAPDPFSARSAKPEQAQHRGRPLARCERLTAPADRFDPPAQH